MVVAAAVGCTVRLRRRQRTKPFASAIFMSCVRAQENSSESERAELGDGSSER